MEVFLNRHPHVREIPTNWSTPYSRWRITPACAGNTQTWTTKPNDHWDHPRMCGKYVSNRPRLGKRRGSPPHVREIPIKAVIQTTMNRITPACAGNTLLWLYQMVLNQDHPRMCGKYTFQAFLWQVPSGSPPHVREIHQLKSILMDIKRITPACAGNTLLWLYQMALSQDHPRMCGKYARRFMMVKNYVGSPPHVREIPKPSSLTFSNAGITPACAGNTTYNILLDWTFLGSPPHVREIPSWIKKNNNTWLDHPRMCGKYTITKSQLMLAIGSPPHVREIQWLKLLNFF